MQKPAIFVLAVWIVMSFATLVQADDFELIAREISPGINLGDRTVGALFVGKFFDSSFSAELGRFTIVLDHDGEGVEECRGNTQLLRFKLIMNFNSGARLVLLGPTDKGQVSAEWNWNDPECVNGNCPLIDGADYDYYVELFDGAPADLSICSAGGNAFLAGVSEFRIARQRFGSYGTNFSGGSVTGYLVHTPIISPALFGSISLE